MNKVYTISHEHQQQSKVALNGQHYADVFDDRWKSGKSTAHDCMSVKPDSSLKVILIHELGKYVSIKESIL